jgi:hypothetical protein
MACRSVPGRIEIEHVLSDCWRDWRGLRSGVGSNSCQRPATPRMVVQLSVERLATVLLALGYGAVIIWASEKTRGRLLIGLGRAARQDRLHQSCDAVAGFRLAVLWLWPWPVCTGRRGNGAGDPYQKAKRPARIAIVLKPVPPLNGMPWQCSHTASAAIIWTRQVAARRSTNGEKAFMPLAS